MTVRFHKHFLKQLKKLPKKDRQRVQERLELFIDTPNHPLLRDHALLGTYHGYRSIDIRPDLRAVYKEYSNEAIFVTLGTHSQLYK